LTQNCLDSNCSQKEWFADYETRLDDVVAGSLAVGCAGVMSAVVQLGTGVFVLDLEHVGVEAPRKHREPKESSYAQRVGPSGHDGHSLLGHLPAGGRHSGAG
jgi:hypothetical protein